MQLDSCPVCYSSSSSLIKEIQSYRYYQCLECDVIFISNDILSRMDQGLPLIEYKENYWQEELYSARQRSWGSSLARVAELFLYARLPIKKFVDIGSGPGFLLDAINYQLPSSCQVFYATELFPAHEDYCTKNENYHRGSFLELNFAFDAGSCIEVIEHITPAMLINMMAELATKSKPNSIYVFNTGLVDYIKNEDIDYLDPLIRGHVMGWSIKALQILLEPLGFKILPIPGKTWAFIAEFRPDHGLSVPLTDRIWNAVPENTNTLRDKKTGDLMYILGLDTTRAYR